MSSSIDGTPRSTRNLLDGAIAAAERPAALGNPPAMSAPWWAWQLVNQWHSAHRSLALLEAAISRYASLGRSDLARFAARKLSEEAGHDEYPLRDLERLGYDGGALVASLAPDAAFAAGLDYAGEALFGDRPAEFLGYVYALERRVIRIPPGWFRSLERVLPPGVDAARGLRSHANDLDFAHVEEAIVFFAALPAEDRAAVAVGCHRITQIRCAGLLAAAPSDAQLAEWLSPFAIRAPVPPTHQRGEP